MVQTSSLLSSGSVICLVQHLNKVNSYILHVTHEDSIRYCLGPSVIGEQLSLESKCRESSCRRRACVGGEQVSGEQMSVGNKCRWGTSVVRANVRGATVWGAPFMESY